MYLPYNKDIKHHKKLFSTSSFKQTRISVFIFRVSCVYDEHTINVVR